MPRTSFRNAPPSPRVANISAYVLIIVNAQAGTSELELVLAANQGSWMTIMTMSALQPTVFPRRDYILGPVDAPVTLFEFGRQEFPCS
jgi:hypothetical protein